MFGFKLDQVFYFVLAYRGCSCNVVEGLKGCGPVFLDQLMSSFYSLVVSSDHWFFHSTQLVP